MLSTELLIDKEVIEHSKRTDSEALKEKSLTIFKNFAFWLGSSFAFCFKTFKIANCRISPIYSTDSLFICCFKYPIASSGFVLFNKRKALRLAERSVSVRRSSSTFSSISPTISDPK